MSDTEPDQPIPDDSETISLDEARRLRAENQSLRQRLRTTEGERDKLQGDTAKAVANARKEGAAEATAAAVKEILDARVHAAAATRLTDPADAARFLDLDSLGDGSDHDALTLALDELLEAKPYLARAATNGEPAPPVPTVEQGTPGAAPAPPTLNFNDMLRGISRAGSVTGVSFPTSE